MAFVSNRPDVRHLLLTKADIAIVIASDGLTDVMSDQDAADLILSTIKEQVGHSPALCRPPAICEWKTSCRRSANW